MITDYLRNALLNHALGVAQFTMPSTVWAGLFNTAPQQSGALPLVMSITGVNGIEVSASDYSRIATLWHLASAGAITNSSVIRFPGTGQTLNDWRTATSIGLLDSPVSGNLLFFGPLSASVLLPTGTDFEIPVSGLSITLS